MDKALEEVVQMEAEAAQMDAPGPVLVPTPTPVLAINAMDRGPKQCV